MNDVDDSILLRRFAVDRAEEPFAEFVRRRLPLVYSAALRRLGGDAHLAEDVTQAVFCAVARNARKLSQHRSVTGWLYTATRFAATDAIRAESRRRVREQEVYAMEQTLAEAEAPTDWERIRPALDAAMDRLNDSDREAVLLRFFEGRAFAEIGVTLGLSEDTARKRVERALDKLRGVLERRKIASTSAALGALLAGETMAAVPTHLAVQITGAALTAGSLTTATVAFLGLSKLQVGVVAAVLATGAAGLLTQQLTISGLREEAQQTRQHVARLVEQQRVAATAQAAAETELTQARAERATLEKSLAEARSAARALPAGKLTTAATAGRGSGSRSDALARSVRERDTEAARRQRADLHHRYDPFLAQRGISGEDAERFIDALIMQADARDDLQQSVRAAGLNGDHPKVSELRTELYGPSSDIMIDLLGRDGLRSFSDYEQRSFYQGIFVESLQADLKKAGMPLNDEQTDRLIALTHRHRSLTRRRPTDVSSSVTFDWEAIAADAREFLTPPQQAALAAQVRRRLPAESRPANPSP